MKQLESIITDNQEAVKILQSVDGVKHLAPFYKKPKSLTEAATEIGVSLAGYSYWIRKFLKTDLVRVAYTRERSGSGIKYYQTPARHMVANIGRNAGFSDKYYQLAIDEYNDGLAEAFTSLMMSWEHDFGINTHVNKEGEMRLSMDLISKDGQILSTLDELLKLKNSATFAVWQDFPLRFEDAKELQQKMYELIQEYEKRSINGLANYYVQMIMVPESV